jgi:hypothetical protein
MINPTYPLASWFVLISAVCFTAVYALPMSFFPLQWAKAFQWKIPVETDLAVYFGKCLGLLGVGVLICSLPAIAHPERNLFFFDLVGWFGGFMTVLHIYGAIRKVQPWTETVEIVFWAANTVLAVYVKPVVG